MAIVDDIVDQVVKLRGLRDRGQAVEELPAIGRALGQVLGRVRALRLRRSPELDSAVDWFHRELSSAPLTDGQRTELAEVQAQIKARVGAVAPDWRPAPSPRRPGARA